MLGDKGIAPLFEWGEDGNLTILKMKQSYLTDVSLIKLAKSVGPQVHFYASANKVAGGITCMLSGSLSVRTYIRPVLFSSISKEP